jgi:acyl-coenzyme A synthetase/AMP-(fatty) acid ligase
MDQVMGKEPGVWLGLTSVCFDISVVELFWTLSRGSTLVIQGDESRSSNDNAGYSIAENIVRHGVTHVQCTPSLATDLLVSNGDLNSLSKLKKLVLGGEALPSALAERIRPAVRCLLNMYGPTETTVWSSVYPVEIAETNMPIGRPLANTEMYILDQNQHPVPIGVSGELYIGGDGLARGYLDRPDLTAEKFISHPFKPQHGARLYRTGDKVRFRSDGVIEFLGRLDHQVKIRGHRIELGEVEFTLRQHPGTRECVVVAREENGDKRLAAYLVSKTGSEVPTAIDLRYFLEERLPRYMVPATFTFLEALPLTPNGKIDRNALPGPDVSRAGDAQSLQQPRSPAEETVASIWRDVLGAKEIGVFDNFFDLGGHSLLMTQVLARIRGAFQIQLVMRRFFDNPTIAGLASAVEEALIEEVEQLSEEEARQLVRRNP